MKSQPVNTRLFFGVYQETPTGKTKSAFNLKADYIVIISE